MPALPARRARCTVGPVALPALRCAVSGVGLDVARLLGCPCLVAHFSLLPHLHDVSRLIPGRRCKGCARGVQRGAKGCKE
eukprot:scaffold108670_cov33-Phaeocystis_antarctica.AAC.1